ncbi:mitochondrial assembly of ribosomal large subunit protein 1 [Glossina fuscipes]|uniref:Mitochondrial assembly of ribosomal large subunit protein 1 n=1 Tax=Glossina fuscipes TaxID=7396 RepID=A0A9C6DKL5_9MUSC|nr:mitochondrial assembly of ribosomal large subunit protein 1 [Glossina fuscipes]
MLNLRECRLVRDKNLIAATIKCLYFKHADEIPVTKSKENWKSKRYISSQLSKGQKNNGCDTSGSIQNKYKIFRAEEFSEIFDVEKERQHQREQTVPDHSSEVNLKRGIRGVFDIDSLVEVLRKEGAEDIFVCSVPMELKYVDYLVVCSGRSRRHLTAIAEFVRYMYKVKRHSDDTLPKIEGKESHEWMALDLGNIALHILAPKVRISYDLESLWAIGAEYDREFNKPQDPLVELFEKHSTLLADLKKL